MYLYAEIEYYGQAIYTSSPTQYYYNILYLIKYNNTSCYKRFVDGLHGS